jgi:hypothetical protein
MMNTKCHKNYGKQKFKYNYGIVYKWQMCTISMDVKGKMISTKVKVFFWCDSIADKSYYINFKQTTKIILYWFISILIWANVDAVNPKKNVPF